MKSAILKELRLINFGCFSDYSVEFGSKNVIMGANGTGKTTIADAFCWLFTDKLMNGTTADPRPHDENGNALNNDDIFVTAYMTLFGIREYVFEKQLHRGIKGNETTYAINGVQMRSKEFKAAIVDIFGVTVEEFGYCLSAAHFLKNDVSTRRGILFDLAMIDDDEKLAADDERFISLVPRLQVATLDKCMAECRRTAKTLNSTLDDLFARTDELKKALVAIPGNGYLLERSEDIAKQTQSVQVQIVETDKAMDLLKQFQSYKTELITGRVNSMFGVTEFVFSEPTLTGDPKDICDVRYKGERYGKRLNTGSRVLVECDLVKGFQREYGLMLPLFIDNAESLTRESVNVARSATEQYIALVAEDCELTIEKGE